MGKKEKKTNLLLQRAKSINIVSSLKEEMVEGFDGKGSLSEAELETELANIKEEIEQLNYHETIKELLNTAATKNVMRVQPKRTVKKGKRGDNVGRANSQNKVNKSSTKKEVSKEGMSITTKVVKFKVFDYTNEQLMESIESWVKDLEMSFIFGNDPIRFRNLITRIQRSYYSNPFHNWQHAFSVAQMAVMFIEKADIDAIFGMTSIETLAFIIGALGHDIGHPGNDSNFEIRSGSQIAELYQHMSVLENYHATQLVQIITDDNCNVFADFTPREQLEIQKLVIDVVLATDMTYHKEHVANLKKTGSLLKIKGSQITDEKERRQLLRALMHACDLSGQCMNLHVALRWEDRITEEMERQVKKMEENDLPVPPYLTDLQDAQIRAGHQLHFLESTVIPLWAEVSRVFPAMEGMYQNLLKVVKPYYEILHKTGIENAEFWASKHLELEKGGNVGIAVI